MSPPSTGTSHCCMCNLIHIRITNNFRPLCPFPSQWTAETKLDLPTITIVTFPLNLTTCQCMWQPYSKLKSPQLTDRCAPSQTNPMGSLLCPLPQVELQTFYVVVLFRNRIIPTYKPQPPSNRSFLEL